MNKNKLTYLILIFTLIMVSLLSGCNSSKVKSGGSGSSALGSKQTNPSQSETKAPVPETGKAGQTESQTGTGTVSQAETSQTPPAIDLASVKPNEAGRIMIVMFHNFVDVYKSGDKNYTTTFDDFRKLLPVLYDKGYRLISLTDYMNDNIAVPAGCVPMVFTFDDGSAGQFNLLEENGALTANKLSAVGIMEEFNKLHPDFGLKGTFYVNLGDATFNGKGTVVQRLEYLIGKGFEIGNHTYSHINLKKTTSADIIQKEIGGNQRKMYEMISGYTFTSFSLPYGEPSKDLQQYVVKGEFEGVPYQNLSIMEVGWDPALSPVNVKFNPLSLHRVRASGLVPVEADLGWWLSNEKRGDEYVSDGNAGTVTVPKAKEASVDTSRLNGKRLILY